MNFHHDEFQRWSKNIFRIVHGQQHFEDRASGQGFTVPQVTLVCPHNLVADREALPGTGFLGGEKRRE